jgi:hypothetical protein
MLNCLLVIFVVGIFGYIQELRRVFDGLADIAPMLVLAPKLEGVEAVCAVKWIRCVVRVCAAILKKLYACQT